MSKEILLKAAVNYWVVECSDDIRANLPGFIAPEVVDGMVESHAPDIYSAKRELEFFSVVLTCEDLGSWEATSRVQLLSSHAESLPYARFFLVVPESCAKEAEAFLTEARVSSAQIMSIPD